MKKTIKVKRIVKKRNGEIVVEDGRLVNIDEEKLSFEAMKASKEMIK